MSEAAYTLFYRRRSPFTAPPPVDGTTVVLPSPSASPAAPTAPRVITEDEFDDALRDAEDLVHSSSRRDIIEEAKKLLRVQLGTDDLDFSAVAGATAFDDTASV